MQRKNYIDYLRVFACISVIIIHIFVTARTDFPNHSNVDEFLVNLISSLFHFAVPIFFMITGFLFLSKKKHDTVHVYIKKYVLKYIIAILIFGTIYSMIEEVFNHNYSITMPLKALLNVVQGKTWAHMWYLYSLVGVMLLILLLQKIKDDDNLLKYIFIILFISSFVFPMIEKLFNIKIGIDLILASPYLFYAILGYYLGNDNIKISNKTKAIILGICILIIIVSEYLNIFHPCLITNRLAIFGRYDSPVMIVYSSMIYLLFMNLTSSKKIVSYICPYTYGIYLVHMFWINLLYKFLKINIFNNYLYCFGILIICFLLSWLSAYILKKTPLIKKIL